jgi:hypothetical protein
MPSVNSTAIDRVEWAGGRLTIGFDGGGRYDYFGVPEHVYTGLMVAQSKGRYFNQYIRGKY